METLTDNMINTIEYGSEDLNIEFKPPFNWSARDEGSRCIKGEVIKAVTAFANTVNGGNIYIGIKQPGRGEGQAEEFERIGLTVEDFNSFNNIDNISRFINGYLYDTVKLKLYGGNVELQGEEKKFIVLQILEANSSEPVICKKDYKIIIENRRETYYLKHGSVYIRANNPVESKSVEKPEEWKALVTRLLGYREEIVNSDLHLICSRLIQGKRSKKAVQKISSIRFKEEYEKELKRDGLL